MELTGLRAAVAVADHQHFGRAAAALGVAQSQVSRAVGAVERELGTALFDRDTRTVRITDAGAEFVTEARVALSILDHAAVRAQAVGRGEAGTIAVGTVGSALVRPIPRLLDAFRTGCPEASVTIVEATTAQQVDQLRAGSLDIGFLRPPLPEPGASELDLLVVATEPLVAVLPPGHRLAGRGVVAVSALAAEPFVRTPRALGPGLYDLITSVCRDAGFAPRTAVEAVSMDSVTGLVAAGFGVALVPHSGVEHRGAQVSTARLSPRAPTIPLALAVARRSRSPLVARFVALARDLL